MKNHQLFDMFDFIALTIHPFVMYHVMLKTSNLLNVPWMFINVMLAFSLLFTTVFFVRAFIEYRKTQKLRKMSEVQCKVDV